MIKELDEILDKKDLTVEDYKRFHKIRETLTGEDKEEWIFYNDILYQRLPEIAAKEGNYNFLEEEDK